MTWSAKTAPSIATMLGGDLIELGGLFYLVGGAIRGFGYAGTGILTNEMHAYDPSTDSWSTLAPIPQKLAHHYVGTDGTYIYAAFGRFRTQTTNGSKSWSSDVYKYDPATDSWSTLTPSGSYASADGSSPGTWMGGKLYLPHAYRTTGPTTLHNKCDIYDPATNAITTTTDHTGTTTFCESSFSAVATNHGGLIYIASADSSWGSTYVDQLGVFDPVADTWTRIGPLPVSYHTSVTAYRPVFVAGDGFLFFVGGMYSGTPDTPAFDVWKYEIATDTWSQEADAPIEIAGSTGAWDSTDQLLRIVGGLPDSSTTFPVAQNYEGPVSLATTVTSSDIPLVATPEFSIDGFVAEPGVELGYLHLVATSEMSLDGELSLTGGAELIAESTFSINGVVETGATPYVGMVSRIL